jgi:hypothetical protein
MRTRGQTQPRLQVWDGKFSPPHAQQNCRGLSVRFPAPHAALHQRQAIMARCIPGARHWPDAGRPARCQHGPKIRHAALRWFRWSNEAQCRVVCDQDEACALRQLHQSQSRRRHGANRWGIHHIGPTPVPQHDRPGTLLGQGLRRPGTIGGTVVPLLSHSAVPRQKPKL